KLGFANIIIQCRLRNRIWPEHVDRHTTGDIGIGAIGVLSGRSACRLTIYQDGIDTQIEPADNAIVAVYPIITVAEELSSDIPFKVGTETAGGAEPIAPHCTVHGIEE